MCTYTIIKVACYGNYLNGVKFKTKISNIQFPKCFVVMQ